MFWSKLFSFLSNFLPFGVYILILSLIDSYSWILRGILIGVVCLQVVSGLILTTIIKKTSKKYSFDDNEYTIVRITRDRTSSLNFIVTNIFPLIAFSFDNIGLIVFTVIMIFIIAVLFFKNNLYLFNPFIEIFGWKIYNIELKKETTDSVVSKTYLTNIPIALNSTMKVREFEDDICF